MWPNLENSVRLNGLDGALMAISAAILVATAFTIWSKRQRTYQVPARDISKGHRWFYPDTNTPVFCNVCELLVNNIGQCDSCGIYADPTCMKTANKDIPCKPLSWAGPVTKHHWVKGNLPIGSCCQACNQECGAEGGLSDDRCCWCQWTVHTGCRADLDPEDSCNLGRYRDCVIPPNCVSLKGVGWKGRQRFVVKEVQPPEPTSWSPVIVVANRKSGNNDGERILQSFRAILNPVQVIDLCDMPLESALEWCHLLSAKATCRILICGGDGTIGWVLDTIDKLRIKPSPHVAILPLGTGNDLSRVLGWGEGTSGDVDAHDVIHKLENAEAVLLDRWKITIQPRSLGMKLPKKIVYMNNYFSVGVDALVTLKFHQTRESGSYFFGSRLLNKFLFASYATKDVWERECKNLREKVSLWLDDNKVDLPDIESIVILNIPSWGAGVQPWQLGSPDSSFQEQKFDDNLIEVFGVYSTFHIAQMQVGLSEPVRLGQAKVVKVILTDKVPMQVDGEPWEQGASEISVSFYCQTTMLSRRT